MILQKGDLIRIPAETCIIQLQNELALVRRYRYTKKPEIGIFIKYDSGNEALVFVRNEYCHISCRNLSILRKSAC